MTTHLTVLRDGSRLGARLSNEATLATILSISREAVGEELTPVAVHYRHTPSSSAASLEAHFKCPVRFGEELDALVFETETLSQPNQVADESVHKFFETYLEEELAQRPDQLELATRVRTQITQHLSEGVPKISDIAARLGLSGRTLQRRLADNDLSYQTLVDEARRQLAQRLLTQTDYQLAEVAFLTGFSEQSTFNRAFKRWSGQTPRSFRIESKAQKN